MGAFQLRPPFSVRDVYRKEWTLLCNRVIVHKACEELVDADWLATVPASHVMGRPKSPVYLINPKVKRDQKRDEEIYLEE